MTRIDKRNPNELRSVFLGPGFAKFAHGSCFVKFGDTHVLCTATIEEKVPHFLKIQKQDGLQPNTECFLVLLKTELTERQRKANNLDVLKKFNDLLGEVFAQ